MAEGQGGLDPGLSLHGGLPETCPPKQADAQPSAQGPDSKVWPAAIHNNTEGFSPKVIALIDSDFGACATAALMSNNLGAVPITATPTANALANMIDSRAGPAITTSATPDEPTDSTSDRLPSILPEDSVSVRSTTSTTASQLRRAQIQAEAAAEAAALDEEMKDELEALEARSKIKALHRAKRLALARAVDTLSLIHI